MNIYSIFVTCCDHPDNEYDWIPGCVWSCAWDGDDPVRNGVQMISQLVRLSEGEPVRYLNDQSDEHRIPMRDPEGNHTRERIRETCAGCGQTLLMRDDTWNKLSKSLEGVDGLWRRMYPRQPNDDHDSWEATISLAMLARLAEEMRNRQGQARTEVDSD